MAGGQPAAADPAMTDAAPPVLARFLARLRQQPGQIGFADTLAVIDTLYAFTPVAFRNGDLSNAAGQNSGSCRLLAFARRHGLTEAETLACFGSYYRDDVLRHPHGDNHPNIRSFMAHGWAGVVFAADPLTLR